MNGFKDGAADDAFSSDDPDSEADDTDATAGGEASETTVDDRSEPELESTSPETGSSSGGLPWIYQRSSITDGREQTVQLHLQSSTLDEQRDAQAAVEKQLGERVKKADLREAAVLVGLQHVDEVAAQLREWGYDVE